MSTLAPKSHFIDLKDHSYAQLRAMIDAAEKAKADHKGARQLKPLTGKTLVMIFETASTRTRLSFDVAMRNLGGETIVVSGKDMQLGRGESIADTARVLSRYCDAVMIRILDHDHILELAQNASVPVINALTRQSHPCQVMADILTIEEKRGSIKGQTIAWLGDNNNMLNTYIEAAALFGFALRIASPASIKPTEDQLEWAMQHGADIKVCATAIDAVRGADVVMTDTWTSMGDDEDEKQALFGRLMPFQVNAALMSYAAKDAIFMHCLPAHREEEVSTEVIDGVQSVVFDQAENRVYVQSAILAHCLNCPI